MASMMVRVAPLYRALAVIVADDRNTQLIRLRQQQRLQVPYLRSGADNARLGVAATRPSRHWNALAQILRIGTARIIGTMIAVSFFGSFSSSFG